MFPIPYWNHCPTADNPADLLTRRISAEQLQSSSLWKHCPQWLLSESQWPHWKPSQVLQLSLSQSFEAETPSGDFAPTQLPEEKTGIHRVIDISRYSALSTLLGVTAYVLRFLSHLRKHEPKHVGPLSAKERHLALYEWVKTCQTLTYSDEIANLTSQSQSRLPLVRQLRLFFDSNGLPRCGRRIHNAPLDDSAKFPFLLPLSKLIIHDVHIRQQHSFWITSIRQHVRKQLKHCVTCRKLEGAAYRSRDPAPLPKLRVQEAPPFTITRVDFAGPLYVKSNNCETKAYICQFTCAVTRAIHFEVVTDLTESSFLQAFRRFSSRKSSPVVMISDNASTCLASAETLQELFQSPSLKEVFGRQGIDWKFIPKRAP